MGGDGSIRTGSLPQSYLLYLCSKRWGLQAMSLCLVLVLVGKKRKGCNEADTLSPMRRDGTSGRECGRERSSPWDQSLQRRERMPLVLFPSATKLPLARSARMRSNATWRWRCALWPVLWLTLVEWVDINQGCFPRLDFPRYMQNSLLRPSQLASNFSIIMGTVL